MLIKQKEGTKLDFKELLSLNTESEKKELAKDIIAIANSIGGRGYLIIGVRDKNKDIIGINTSDFNEERIQQIISYRCDPPISVRAEVVNYLGKEIGVITVFNSNQRPHQMRQTGAFYIRRGSTTDFARRNEIASMFQEIGLISNELIPIYSGDIDALNNDSINSYLTKMGLRTDSEVKLELWRSLGFIHMDGESGKYFPTIGGLLLFCDKPQIYLPYSIIKFINTTENNKEVYTIEGNIIELLHKSNQLLEQLFKNSSYPIEAIAACLANAVVHRDYFDLGREIVVTINLNTIEISNPGALLKSNSIHTLMGENNPSRRNYWLYQRLLVLDENNRFINNGIGLELVSNMLKSIGRVKIINIEKRNLFKVILPK